MLVALSVGCASTSQVVRVSPPFNEQEQQQVNAFLQAYKGPYHVTGQEKLPMKSARNEHAYNVDVALVDGGNQFAIARGDERLVVNPTRIEQIYPAMTRKSRAWSIFSGTLAAVAIGMLISSVVIGERRGFLSEESIFLLYGGTALGFIGAVAMITILSPRRARRRFPKLRIEEPSQHDAAWVPNLAEPQAPVTQPVDAPPCLQCRTLESRMRSLD